MTHTSGPWTIQNGCICAPNGRALLRVDAIGGETEAEVAGNVALITTAAELLDLLCLSLPYVEDALDDETIKKGVVKADAAKIRAVIAKAEGRPA